MVCLNSIVELSQLFNRLGHDEDKFCATYPEAHWQKMTALLAAIQKRHVKLRKSKNGTPDQRDSHSPVPSEE